MERLTKRLPGGAANYNYPKSCYIGDRSGADRISQSAFRQRCVEQLADYEDTKLTPEEIDMDHEAAEQLRHLCRNCDLDRLKKLAEADKDGRLVVLPCKVGTATYYIHYPIAVYPDESEPEIKRGIFTLCDLDRVGHSVFLTREEAEKALKVMKDE